MFPDYDDLILQSVLESVRWNQDLAVDALLGMSDPEYRSEQPPQPPAPVMSQEELDEQFARQLMLQEQEQHQRRWAAANPNAPAVYHSSRPHGTGAWNPPPQGGQQPQQSGTNPNMAELQEQFSKIAETGKKTFGNIFSKVKAKIQELDQGRPAGSGPPQGSNQGWPSPGGAPSAGAASYFPPPQPSQPQAQAAYYDPNPQPTAGVATGHTPSPARKSPPAGAVQGYDVGGSYTPPVSTSPSPPTSNQPQPTSIAPPATGSTASPGPIDAGKFGLLPKRPVSLLRDPGAPPIVPPSGSAPAAASAKVHHVDDDDDGLEYAENPFEEDKK